MIDLGDAVGAAVGVGVRAHEVRGDRAAGAAARRPERQHVGRDRVDRHAELAEQLRRRRHPRRRRRRGRDGVARGQLLDLEGRKEERLVVDDRSAEREAGTGCCGSPASASRAPPPASWPTGARCG